MDFIDLFLLILQLYVLKSYLLTGNNLKVEGK
jgi:hypothetical protein